MCHVLHYSCNINAAVADSLHCRMICGAVPSSVHAWMPPATAATWSPAAAHSKSLPQQRGRRDRRWSCATTVEHAATVTMQIADAHVTRCLQYFHGRHCLTLSRNPMTLKTSSAMPTHNTMNIYVTCHWDASTKYLYVSRHAQYILDLAIWPWPLTSDLENIFRNAHSRYKYLSKVSFKSIR